MTLTAKKPSNIPQNPKTIGDHIKKRRLELGLFQKDVGQVLGIDESTVTNWEKNRTRPQLHLIPKVIEFLRYNPYIVEARSLGEKIREYRKTRGMSQAEMARRLNVDPSTLARWERDKGRPPVNLDVLLKQGDR